MLARVHENRPIALNEARAMCLFFGMRSSWSLSLRSLEDFIEDKEEAESLNLSSLQLTFQQHSKHAHCLLTFLRISSTYLMLFWFLHFAWHLSNVILISSFCLMLCMMFAWCPWACQHPFQFRKHFVKKCLRRLAIWWTFGKHCLRQNVKCAPTAEKKDWNPK